MKCQDNEIYAGFFVRFFAFLIDSLIVGCITGFFGMTLGIIAFFNEESILNKSFLFNITWLAFLIYVCKVSYYIITTYSDGSTLGKRIMRIRVVYSSDMHKKLGLFDVIYRETIGKFLSGVLNLGYILIGVTNKKTALHDILCDTRVIYYTRFVVRKTIYKTMVNNVPNPNIPKEVASTPVSLKKDDNSVYKLVDENTDSVKTSENNNDIKPENKDNNDSIKLDDTKKENANVEDNKIEKANEEKDND